MTRKKKKGRRNIAAAQSLPVGPLVHEAADRIGPLAHQAADRIGPIAQDAADRIAPIAQAAVDRVQPYARQAAERVRPLAEQAADRVQPYARQAVDWIEPYAHEAADWIGPYADTARKRGAQAAVQAVEKLGPTLDEAVDRITPAVQNARDRLQSDVLPKLSERLNDLAGAGAVTAVAAKGRDLLPIPVKRKKRRWPKRLAVVAGVLAAGGAAFVAVRRLLGGNDGVEWETPRPSTPYASTTITEPPGGGVTGAAPDTVAASARTASEPEESITEAAAQNAPEAAAAAGAEAATAARPAHAAEEPSPTGIDSAGDLGPDTAGSSAADAATAATIPGSTYGEGAYIGTEPPEGYAIKGNERSRKYHMPDSSGYERTNADVWFSSEEAAQAAGFTRAQR